MLFRSVNTGHGDAPGVPVGDVAAGSNLSDVKALLNTLQIVLEPVGHQNGPAVRAFDQVFQRVELPVVEEQAVVFGVIDAAKMCIRDRACPARGTGA